MNDVPNAPQKRHRDSLGRWWKRTQERADNVRSLRRNYKRRVREQRHRVYVAWLVLWFSTAWAFLCWGLLALFPNGLTALIFGIVLPFGVPLVVLREIRGSVKAAKEEEFQRVNNLVPMLWEMFPDRVRHESMPGEVPMARTKRHPISILLPRSKSDFRFPKLRKWEIAGEAVWLIAFFGSLLSGDLGALALVILIGSPYLAIRIWMWRRDELFITDGRLVRIWGIVDVKTGVMPRLRLTDLSKDVPLLSRFLAWLRIIWVPYGKLRFESAGQDQGISVITLVPNVNEIGRLASTESPHHFAAELEGT
jgi:hypothetical protein